MNAEQLAAIAAAILADREFIARFKEGPAIGWRISCVSYQVSRHYPNAALTTNDVEALRRYIEDVEGLRDCPSTSVMPSYSSGQIRVAMGQLQQPRKEEPMLTKETLRAVGLHLLQDSDFMSDFKRCDTAKGRRIVIHDKSKFEGLGLAKLADREAVRRFIEYRAGIYSPDSQEPASFEPYELENSLSVIIPNDTPQAQLVMRKEDVFGITPQGIGALRAYSTNSINSNSTEITMNSITKTQAIEITTQVNINGQNIKTFSDASLYSLIQQQEAEIKSLNALQNKPQSLLAEIQKRQAGIDALVNYLNERDAVATAPAVAAPAAPAQRPLDNPA